jgi:hypothetical protein
MALNSALVDRARIVSRAPVASGRKVEGTTVYEKVEGPWFKARLFPEMSAAQLGVENRRRIIPDTPTMLAALLDVNGDPVVITSEARIEVDSKELGNEVWDVSGEPQPLRKKRRVIGWYFGVRRVYTVEQEDAA